MVDLFALVFTTIFQQCGVNLSLCNAANRFHVYKLFYLWHFKEWQRLPKQDVENPLSRIR